MDLIRGFSPLQLQALSSSAFYPNLMVHVDWPGDPLRFNMGDTDIEWNGETFYGFGPMGALSLPPEAPGIAASTANLSIAGVDAELDGKMNAAVRGRGVQIYLAMMGSREGGNRLGPPIPLFRGTIGSLRMRTSSVNQNEVFNRIEVDLSTGPSARSESSIYHTNEDQQRRFPGDTAGRLVILSYAKAQKLRWPE